MLPLDLAQAGTPSQQTVRDYEEAGIPPPATRLANGYRETHLAALNAVVALAALRPYLPPYLTHQANQP
ncbi:hypothetical protein AB0B25_03555 [Nocardia sp. NPDC049190]|uniref:hypothetical protein n=1 Tax=Nocardia sp. NPDC049190 TaxID=3155650 RepID=UPI0034096C71